MTNRFERMVASVSDNGQTMSDDAAINELRIIVVAGVASKAGKTSLAEAVTRVLASRTPVGAAKITVTHGERGCPHGGKGCNVCSSLGGEYRVIGKPSIIGQEGTDTARLEAAGAHPVVWAITRAEFILDAYTEMRKGLSEVSCAVIESNTLAVVTKPALTLMIVDPTVSRRLWKPSAETLIARAEIVVFNDRGTRDKRLALLKEIESLRGTTEGVIELEHPSAASGHAGIVSAVIESALTR